MTSGSDRITRLFTITVIGYFACHIALRSLLGGAFEMDEAEMVLLAQEFRSGYGPQLPFYNWWQALWFALFGVNAFAVAAAKNLMIAATYLFLYAGLARVYPARLALAGALSLMLLPNFAWEAQRANTHSTAMCLMMAAFLWALAGVLTQRRKGDYLALGLALGLGAISKYNFFLYALPLLAAGLWEAAYRPALRSRGMAGALALMVAIMALPYGWLLANGAKATASVGKFYGDAPPGGLPPWIGAAGLFLGSLLAGLLLVVIAALALRGRRIRAIGAVDSFTRLMARAFALSCLLGLAGAMAAGLTEIQVRWLLPQFLLGAPLLLIWGAQAAGGRALKRLGGVVAVLALLVLAAMADIRLRGAGSDSLRIDLLAEQIEAQTNAPPLVVADYYYAGNLRYHRPGWVFAPRFDLGRALSHPGPVVLIATYRSGGDTVMRDIARLAPSHSAGVDTVLDIPHRFAPEETRQVHVAILHPSGG